MIHDEIQALVDKQAEDEGLWFFAFTAPEAYLQQELRKLHAAIEARTPNNGETIKPNPKGGIDEQRTTGG